MTTTLPSTWTPFRPDEAAVETLVSEIGVSPITARVLVARGLSEAGQARRFLEPSLERDWPATQAIAGMGEAASRVAAAVRAGERIVVFGDFDLDGVSSAALVEIGLAAMGARVTSTVPHRFREGYGLTPAAIERLRAMSPDLVVTVDCGISGRTEVAWLREQGIDVVVTDHHEPGEDVPTDVPIADPKCAAQGPELAGAGVALALVKATGELLGHDPIWRDLVDLAMLGTVADVVPLVGANRALVADGLDRTRTKPRPGIAALAAVAGIEIGEISADRIAFGLAPRLNAAGRMADPALALRLLTTTDIDQAEELARALEEHNRLRQVAENDLLDAALNQAADVLREGDRLLVVSGEGWHEGVRGIVASRLVSRFGIPALVMSVEDGVAQGSGRSVPGVDLFAALSTTSHLLTRFGGHAAAVGLTLPVDRLPEVTALLARALQAIPEEVFVSRLPVDAVVPLDALSRELAAELRLLEPYGFGNPRPVLASGGVFLTGRRAVGKYGQHLRFTAYDGVAALPGVMFRCTEIGALLSSDASVDIAFELELDEWRGQERLQVLARDIRVHEAPEQGAAAELVEDLFAHAQEILARGEYAGIGEAESFHTKLAGVTFEGRQGVVAGLTSGTPLRIDRQRDNEHDPNACALREPSGAQVGYFNRRLAAVLAPLIDADVEYDVTVSEVTGGDAGASFGVNVLVVRRDASEQDIEAAESARERRMELAALDASALDDALRGHLIGERPLHPAQREALDHLGRGRRTLAVMATGRGKSLIFHLHAARHALREGAASLFVYPLRALVADQGFHLHDSLAGLGLTLRTLTGETAPDDRDETFAGLADGSVDIVLTTPEFLDHHAARLSESGRVRFVAVDEAHHIARARTGHRPAYARLGRALATLGEPQVLATTATADAETARTIHETLLTESVVVDPTVRDNLYVEDRRGCSDKRALVSSLAARGEKVIVYVNSRDTTVQLARTLRSRVPSLEHAVAFYNGGMTRSSRHAVERAFRDGSLRVVVATSAFGEGVNIPDVRHVVLYHLPFGAVEFNQMCGRGGRDGRPAGVHLLFSERDARINRAILSSLAPPRDDLAALYLVLKRLAASDPDGFEITNAELAERVKDRRPKTALSDAGISSALGIFRELGLVTSEGHGPYRRLRLLPTPTEKLDLAASVRYAEGMEELEDFDEFDAWVRGASPGELLHAFNRPILPEQPSGPTGPEG